MLPIKAKLRLSQKYQESAFRNFFKPFAKKFGKRKLNMISAKEIEKYVFSHRTWSARTKISHLNYLRTFFSFFVKQGNVSLNPVTNIAKPKVVEEEPCLLVSGVNPRTIWQGCTVAGASKTEERIDQFA
jgi:site-specific recombinase XerD